MKMSSFGRLDRLLNVANGHASMKSVLYLRRALRNAAKRVQHLSLQLNLQHVQDRLPRRIKMPAFAVVPTTMVGQ